MVMVRMVINQEIIRGYLRRSGVSSNGRTAVVFWDSSFVN